VDFFLILAYLINLGAHDFFCCPVPSHSLHRAVDAPTSIYIAMASYSMTAEG
jgi:hypothetical protein